MSNISVKYNWSQILAQYALQLTNTGIILYKNISNSNLIDMRGTGRAQIIYDPTDDKVKISENGSSFIPIVQSIPPIPPFYNFLAGSNMNVQTSGSNVTYSTISNPTFTEATINGNINITGLVDGYDISTMGATVTTLSSYLNQDVKTTASPIFSNATIAGYNMSTIGALTTTLDGEVMVLMSRVDQPVLISSSPTFANATISGYNINTLGSYLNQDVKTTASPIFSNATISGYNINTLGSTVSTLSSYLNQSVLTSSSPTFNELTLTSSTPLKLFVAGSSNKVATVSALHWDPTNSRLGINTSSPSTTLDISSSVVTPNLRLYGSSNVDNRIFAYLTNSGTADPLFRMVAARGLVANAVGDVTAQLGLEYGGIINSALRFHRGGSSTDSFSSFTTNGLERMRIDNSGNVLINTTTSGSYKLDINGSTRTSNLIITNYPILGGTSTSTASVYFMNLLASMITGETKYITFGQNTSTGNQAELGFVYDGNNSLSNKLVLGFYGNQIMTLTNGGNIGISQSNPTYKLDVTGQSRFSNGVIGEGTNGVLAQNTSATSYALMNIKTDTVNDFVIFKNGSSRSADGGSNTTTIRNNGGSLALTSLDSDLIFSTGGSERYRVSSTGNIIASGGSMTFSNPNTGSNNTSFIFQNGTTGSDGSIVLQPWSGGSSYITMNYITSGFGFIRGYINGSSNTPFITLSSSGGAKHDYLVIGTSNLNVAGAVRYNSGNLEYYNGSSWQQIVSGSSPTLSGLTVNGNITTTGSNRGPYGDFNNLNAYTDAYMKVNNRFVNTQFASEGDAFNYFQTLGGIGLMQFMVGNGSPSGIGSSDYAWAFGKNNATGKRYYQLSSTAFFTGQHCVKSIEITPENIYDYIGKIVCSSGTYIKPLGICDALPNVELSSRYKQKNAFGVVTNINNWNNGNVDYIDAMNSGWSSGLVDEECILVNSIGEGGIWIISEIQNILGIIVIHNKIENGDYITTSDVPGYGIKQEEEMLCNYTVAKITQDENFTIENDFEYNGKMYRKAFVGCTYHCG